ncbi:MAG: helix-turn-helix transcriptional regulator, partial [Chloroflexota bacterium]
YAYCDMRSRFYEGESLFRAARRGCAPGPVEKPHPAWALALLSWYDQRVYLDKTADSEIVSQAESCLAQGAESLGRQGMAAVQVLMGAILEYRQDFRSAIQYYQQGLQRYPQLDDFYWVTMRMGLCCQASGDLEQALRYFQESYIHGSEQGERVKTGWSLLNTGETLALQGRRSEAEKHLLEALNLFQEVGTAAGIIWANSSLGRLALENGDLERASDLAGAALKVAQQIHYTAWLVRLDDLIDKINGLAARSPQEERTTGEQPPEDKLFYEPLSEREQEVMRLLESDLDGPEIARRLYVSINTLRFHTKNIYSKLHVRNRLEAIRRARELGL